jgi:hemerythrin-like metal-binding protein
MSGLVWKDSYALGIPIVDAEHRELIGSLESLDALVRGGGDPSEARLRLAQLTAQVGKHFRNEEEFLDAVGCPELERQRSEHADYLEHLRGMSLMTICSAASALDFARDWLLEHFRGTDPVYARWLDGELPPVPRAFAVRGYGALRV